MSEYNFPETLPISANHARVIAANFNRPPTETLLFALNALIFAQAQLGLYSITYTATVLDQFVINQLISTGYVVVDTSVTNVPPTPIYNYLISWEQLNYPAAGQPQ